MDERGYIQLYTGNGKGKTTAAIGLAIRAVGAGKRVFIGQFVKGMHYAELDALRRFPEVEVRQFGRDCFIKNEPTPKDIDAARKGLDAVKLIIEENVFDLVLLDEICIALHYKLFSVDEVLSILKTKPEAMEIVLTGRYALDRLVNFADLVTRMEEVKHYYNNGVEARKGIEF